VHIPDSLLVEVGYVRFDNDTFRLRPDTPVGARERAFLENYQRDFSWGVARQSTQDLLQMMHEAPAELRELLGTPFEFDMWLEGPTLKSMQHSYFASRQIQYKNKRVVMPIVELANYGRPAQYELDDGVGLSGQFDGEIVVLYMFSDVLEIFKYWGFVSEDEFIALSLPMGLQGNSGFVKIGKARVDNPERDPFFPYVSVEGDRITLSYLMLGHKRYPKLAKGIFHKIMRDAGRTDEAETFDKIQHVNRTQLHKLIAASENAAAPLGRLLRHVSRLQLETLSCCVGSAEM
jgi:hypothetical protein